MMPRSTTSSTCSSMRMLSLATKWTILHTRELRNERKARRLDPIDLNVERLMEG